MTVTLKLKPELEKCLLAEARAQRLSVEDYLVSMVEAAALPATAEHAGLEEFDAAMDELADGLDDAPLLAPEALTRESIYGHRG